VKKVLLVLFVWLTCLQVDAQQEGNAEKEDEKLVQFSGIVMTADSLMTLSYVNITIKRTLRGTFSDMNGYFNFVALKGDTILFNSIGYKSSTYIIPDSLTQQKYSMIKLMTTDTTYLAESIVRPLPTREMFNYFFVNVDIPDDDMERARKNLERERLKEAAEKMGPDGAEIAKAHLNRQAQQYYYAGQLPPNNLLNPFAWAQFFEAWKNGDFKKKSKYSDK
jgi:hypothetical protein